MQKSVKISLLVTMSLAGCFLLLGGTASAQIVGFADSENGASFSTWTTTTLTVGGWAVAEEDTKPAASVQILIDGKLVGSVVPSTARTDVVAYLGGNNAYLNCGWSFSYNAGATLTPGGHTLSVLAFDAEGISAPLTFTGTASPSLTILTPQPPQGFLDGMNAATFTQSQSIVVSGWAGDPQDGAPVKQVQILMDGNAVGNATLGIKRTDVTAVYPQYVNAGWTFTYSAASLAGSHTFTAVASDRESLSTKLTVIAQNTITVLSPELAVTSVGVTGTPASGGKVTVADTTTNSGAGPAGASYTFFYMSTDGVTKGASLGDRYLPSVAAGGSSSGTTSVTLPSNIGGTYYILACANATNTVVESVTITNCMASAPFSVVTPELAVTSVSVTGTLASGGKISVADTTTNSGGGAAGASYTFFYMSTDGVTKGASLGDRYLASLAAGGSSSGTTTVTLPTNITGPYYILACANATNTVVESSTITNCMASTQFSVAGADLTVSAVGTNPAAALPGGTLAITDTTADAFANANLSITGYYLSTTTTLVKSGSGAAVLLGTRSVPALTPTTVPATSTGTVNVSIPASTVAGNYYVFACANNTSSVVESNVNNNCTATPVVVYTAANTMFVNQKSLNAENTGCGTSQFRA